MEYSIYHPPLLFYRKHCFTIILVHKNSAVRCLNEYCPLALTPIAMKCLERHIKNIISPDLDKWANCSTGDAIATTLHIALTHLEEPNRCIRMLSVGFGSSMCSWVMDFLMDWPQQARVGKHTSTTLILNTGLCAEPYVLHTCQPWLHPQLHLQLFH